MSTSQRGMRNFPGSLSSVYGPCMCRKCVAGLSSSSSASLAVSIRSVDDGRLQNLRDNFLDQDTNPIERLREAQDRLGVFGEDAWMFIAAEAATNVTSPERWQSNGIRTFWGSLSKVYGPCVCQRCAPGLPNPHHTSLAWIRAVDDGRLHHLHRSFLKQDLIPIERVCEVQELCGDALMLLAKKAEKGESSERWQSNMVPVYVAERDSLTWVKKEHEKEYSAPSA